MPVPLTRRQTIAALGGVATLGAGGYAVTRAADPAAAATVEGFSIDDGTYSTDDGDIYSPWLSVDVTAEWAVFATPDTLRVLLLVGPTDDQDVLVNESVSISATDGSKTVSLDSALVDSTHYDESSFDVADPGATRTVTVPVTVIVQVRSGSETLADTDVQTTTDVTVDHTGVAEVTVSASGVVGFQEESSDPKPV